MVLERKGLKINKDKTKFLEFRFKNRYLLNFASKLKYVKRKCE